MIPQPRTTSPAAALLIAVLALGAMACAWQAVRANSARAAEREARQREAARREEAETQARVAEDQNLEAELVLAFFQTEVPTAKSAIHRHRRLVRPDRYRQVVAGRGRKVFLMAMDGWTEGVYLLVHISVVARLDAVARAKVDDAQFSSSR